MQASDEHTDSAHSRSTRGRWPSTLGPTPAGVLEHQTRRNLAASPAPDHHRTDLKVSNLIGMSMRVPSGDQMPTSHAQPQHPVRPGLRR